MAKKHTPEQIAWLRGHLDGANQSLRALQNLFSMQGYANVASQLQEGQYAIMRAKSTLEKE